MNKKNQSRLMTKNKLIARFIYLIIFAIININLAIALPKYITTENNNLSIGSSSNNLLFIDNTNTRIGIGTTTPSQLLQVNGSLNATTFYGAGTGLTGTASSLSIGGNAGTATALAANGANCNAGAAPQGVDASGAAESCTAYLQSEVDGSTTNELQNIFQTISTTSGTAPVADSTTDTLTLTAGTGITVTGDSTSDTVTIAYTNTAGYITDGNTNWDNSYGYITDDTSVPKNNLANSGTLGFEWSDAEVSNTLTASYATSAGSITSQGSLATASSVSGGSGGTITDDSITDADLAYNTGQHLTTSSSPTFAGGAINGAFTQNGGTFSFGDAGTGDVDQVRLFSVNGNLYLQNGGGDNIYFRSKTAGINMVIQNGGNVGIGTTGPENKLEVGSNTVATNAIKINSAAAGEAGIFFGYDSTYKWELYRPPNSGDLRFWEAGNGDKVTFQAGGNVGIGDTSPDYKLDVWGTICQDTDSNDVCDGTVTSDARLKTNITEIPEARDKIRQLNGVYFYWNNTINVTEHLGRGERQIGLLAQEVEKEFPELIYQDMQGYKMIDYQKITAITINAIKEQENEIENIKTTTKSEIEALKQENQKLREENSQISARVAALETKSN